MKDLKIVCGSVATPLKTAAEWNESLGRLQATLATQHEELELAHRHEAELEEELERLRNDPWASRVTYDNVVEQIAACEDPRERDDARRLIEPMLKRDTVRRFRADIRRKVAEQHGTKPAAPISIVTLNNPRFDGPMNEITGNDNVSIGGYGE